MIGMSSAIGMDGMIGVSSVIEEDDIVGVPIAVDRGIIMNRVPAVSGCPFCMMVTGVPTAREKGIKEIPGSSACWVDHVPKNFLKE